ncbi:MAG: glycoside hydrolase family 97 catalytic domain-containing protein [Oscillospiraceae bacterium]|nr:glycoside hydrolase family 97 catalytic domain-containing protein [Oscillospiraceae bacterium]
MVRNRTLCKIACIAAAAAISVQGTGGLFSQRKQISAAASYAGAEAANQGSAEGAAVIRGSSTDIVHDDTLDSDVLVLNGKSFGSGWLQLPPMLSESCSSGFTFSMRYQLASDAGSYTRLYQFATVPLGTGSTNGYSSPDLSVDLNDKTKFRASVFAGKNLTTENDEAHRSIFTVSAAPDTDWHQLTVVYSPTGGAQYYQDGKLLSTDDSEGAGRLKAACGNLFSENLLQYYTYCAVGHSLYTDSDLRGRIDDVAFYNYPLTAAQAAALPDDPAYLYTFEAGTITESTEPQPETAQAHDGTAVNSIPSLQTESPDGTLVSKIWQDARGSYYYSVEKQGDSVILPSKLGLVTTTEDLSSGFPAEAPTASRTTHDETYSMPSGKHVTIRDHYSEISFPLVKGSSTLTVIMRVYDDGIGVRYSLNHGASIKEEATQVMFPGSSTFWGNWPNATYEWDMVEVPKDRSNETNSTYSCPYTGVIADRYWVTVSEASVFNEENPYCAGSLQFVGDYHSLRFKGGVKVSGITMSAAFHTPWRAVVIGDTLNQMASSDLILNLNPPSVLEDTSWVKPGKVAWSWWSSGGDSPVEYHMQKEYIDFAAENGWDYVCVDFGWALWDDSEAKIKELCDYGKEKGIGIWLWYGVNNTGHAGYKDSKGNPAYPYYSLLDEATIVREFKRISGLGVKGVKVDYYESDTQETMKQMHLCTTIAAENKLMVLFHGCTIPRGESRTYPNVVSFEAINGSEYYKWFNAPSLENRVSYTFTRNVVGSADFTPTGIPIYGINATAGFALADVVTIESGVQHFAHSVYTYEGSPALPLLNDVPVAWDDMYVIDGRPMQFNVTARRSGADWYIGASTIAARTVKINLSDLISDDGKYNAYIFGDNENGSALKVSVLTGLTKDDTITQSLLKNGGFVIKLTKGTMNLDTPYSNYISYEAEYAKRSGQASITEGKDAKYCSNNAYVGYVGGNANNYITFENVNAPEAGEYTLRVYYVSGEPRSLKIDINGKYAAKIDNCYANKRDWKGIRAASVTVQLNKGANTVKLYNDAGYGPSIDRIALAIPNDDALIGDLDGNKKLDVRDLTMMKQGINYGFRTEKAERLADFNRDGTIDRNDAVSLMQFLTAQT